MGAGLAKGYAARANEYAGLKELNLSEKHLAYFVTQPLNDPLSPQNGEGTYLNDGRTVVNGLNNGGYPFLATNTFVAGIGPVLEEEDVSLQYKGGQRQIDGSIDYSKTTNNKHITAKMQRRMVRMRKIDMKNRGSFKMNE